MTPMLDWSCSTWFWRLEQVLLRASTAGLSLSWFSKIVAGIDWAIEVVEVAGVTACRVSISFAIECSLDLDDILLPPRPEGRRLSGSALPPRLASSISCTSFQSTLMASICSTLSFLSRSRACFALASSLVRCLMWSSVRRLRISSCKIDFIEINVANSRYHHSLLSIGLLVGRPFPSQSGP